MFNRKKPITHDLLAEGEAMKITHFTEGLSEIILGYLNYDINTSSNGNPIGHQDFKLFGVSAEDFMREQASLIATLILRGEEEDIEKAMALVKQNPHLVRCVTRAFDPLQRLVEGTLLQIAAMAGDVDLKPGITEEKERGAVERLIAVAGLSPDEVAEQLKVVTSEEAIQENEARNQQILEAIKKFGEDVIALESKMDDNYEQLRARCQPWIDQLEKDLTPDPKRVISSGYIFDLKVLKETLSWYEDNVGRLCWNKSDLFLVCGYGKLQTKLSSRDAQILVRHGNDYDVGDGIPPRTLKNADGISYFYNSQSHLGIHFCLGMLAWEAGMGSMCCRYFERLCQTKTAALQGITNRQRSHSPPSTTPSLSS